MEQISGAAWKETNIVDITELKPENYIELWRLINTEQFQFGEEHVNIASAVANIFVGQELFDLFESFLKELSMEKLALMKKNEEFLRALIQFEMHKNHFSEVYRLIKVNGPYGRKFGRHLFVYLFAEEEIAFLFSLRVWVQFFSPDVNDAMFRGSGNGIY